VSSCTPRRSPRDRSASGLRRSPAPCGIAVAALAAGCAIAPAPPPLDLAALWDFGDPAASELRFRAALPQRGADEAFILMTQVARSHGLRRDFERARDVLRALHAQRDDGGAEAQVRWWLEWGRTWASAAHTAGTATPDAHAEARRAFQRALDIARGARLDSLAVDAVHMMAFVDTTPADGLRWGREALAIVEASDQPAARRWQASIRHNIGHALHQLGRHDEALVEFERALALREAAGQPAATRVARWMIARTWRAQGRLEEALAEQHRLEREHDALGSMDPHVFAELALLYRAKGDAARAESYEARERAAQAARRSP
jgi:tetratricopeptide (TPR) repeat protein